MICLLFFSLILTLAGHTPAQAQSAPQPVSIAVGGDNLTRLLWNNPDGSISLWRMNADTTVAAQYPFGPYPGWAATTFAVGADNAPRVLYNHTADGQMSLWRMDPTAGTFTQNSYGPYSGWAAAALAVGSNNAPRIVWNHTADGQMSLWNANPTTAAFSQNSYGPYSGWLAQAVAVGPDNAPRVLYNHTADGQMSLWRVDPATSAFSQYTYGPYSGWTAVALAVDSTNAPRVLWTSGTTASLWSVAANGGLTFQNYPFPAGYVPVGLACGTGGDVRLLWSDSLGDAQVWTIASGGTYTSKIYPSLSAVAVSPSSVTGGSSAMGTVTLTAPAPAGGMTVALSSSSTSATVPASVLVAAGSATGTFPVTTSAVTTAATATVTATFSGISKTATLTVNPIQTGASGSYDVAAGPINVDVTENTSRTVTAATVIGVSPVNSFTGNVQLAFSGLPSGISAVLSSPTVSLASGNASSNLTFTVASTARPGLYAVDLRATSGSITRSAPVNLTIYPSAQAANFTIAQDVDGLEIEPGGSDTVTLTLNPNAGFNGAVNLSLQDNPANPIVNTTSNGISATFSAPSLSSSGQTSTVTFQVGAQVPENAYHLLIIGTSPTGTQTLVVTVFVLPLETGAGFGGVVPSPSAGPSVPPYSLASSLSNMARYDLDDSGSPQGQVSQLNTVSNSEKLGISFNVANALETKPRPNYLGATDDRIYIRTQYPSLPIPYPYSAVCRVVAYSSNGISVGTGTLIGTNHVLTAAHVLYDTSGHLASKIIVYPGYDNGASRAYHHASAKSIFVPNNYKASVAAGTDSVYDDWAVLDLKPIVGATRADRGKGLGNNAQYMIAADDFVSPDQASLIAGYPNTVRTAKASTNYMYFSGVFIGDDGQVADTPPGSIYQSDNLVFYTIDVSLGDSGAGIFRPDPVGDDYFWHLFAVVRASGDPGTNFNDGTLITTTRKNIIQGLMHNDQDDVY